MSLTLTKRKINTISCPANLIEGSGRAMFTLMNGAELCIHDVLSSTKSRRNFLSFKDIHYNEFHVEIVKENNTKYLCISFNVSS